MLDGGGRSPSSRICAAIHPGYRQRWETKLGWYREQGILPFSEGGGPRGTLVTTCDTEQGGIDSKEIERIVHEVFGV